MHDLEDAVGVRRPSDERLAECFEFVIVGEPVGHGLDREVAIANAVGPEATPLGALLRLRERPRGRRLVE